MPYRPVRSDAAAPQTEVLLSMNAAHVGEVAEVSRIRQADESTQLILDMKGNGVIGLTRANSAVFVPGATYLVGAKNLRVLIRLT